MLYLFSPLLVPVAFAVAGLCGELAARLLPARDKP